MSNLILQGEAGDYCPRMDFDVAAARGAEWTPFETQKELRARRPGSPETSKTRRSRLHHDCRALVFFARGLFKVFLIFVAGSVGKEAYEQMGTAVPRATWRSLSSRLQIIRLLREPSCTRSCALRAASARVEESANSSVSNLEDFCEPSCAFCHARVGDCAAEPRRAEAANKAPVPQKEDPPLLMLVNLERA